MKSPALLSILCILFYLCPSRIAAQNYNQSAGYLKANSKWVFGSNIGFDKNSNGLFPVTGFNTSGATLSVADSATGQLLFYSNGVQCWTAAGQLMPNGSNIGGEGNGGRTQPVCAVPFVGEQGKYYLFALTDPFSNTGINPDAKGKLYYSVLDMSLNNGAGDIVAGQKAILLDSLLGSSIIAIPGNHCDVWLMSHALYTSEFKAYHITAAGLDLSPVVSNAGPAVYPNPIQFGGNTWRLGYTQGQMSVSSDRSRIAYGVISLNGIPFPAGVSPLGFILSKFNPDNGTVYDALQFNEGAIHVYGTGFSPDNTKLYINIVASDNNTTNGVIQYDISNYNTTAITASAFPVFPMGNGAIKQKYMKLYHDTLFLSNQSTGGTPTLSTINSPNLSGAACAYQDAAIPLTGAIVQGITNDVVFALPSDTTYNTLLDITECAGMPVMVLDGPAGHSAYFWDNGSSNRQRIVSERGTYWLISKNGCQIYADTFRIGGAEFSVSLGNDTTLCNQPSLLLQPAAPDNAAFLWQDGSTGNNFTVTAPGPYWTRVTYEGCNHTDTIHVALADLRQNLGPDDIACRGIPVSVNIEARTSPGATMQWSNGSNASSIYVTEPGNYWLLVTDGDCKASDTLRIVRELCDCPVLIPNAFSPNNDGINDVFAPVTEAGCVLKDYELQIFNRWGQSIFYTYSSDGNGWDGTFNHQPCDAGTYFYTIKMSKGTRAVDFKQKGEVILVR